MTLEEYHVAEIITGKELEVLELRYTHNFSWRQIALALKLHRSTVRSRHEAALGKIRAYEFKEAA